MKAVSGSFAGKARMQAVVGLSDVQDHALMLVEIVGPQRSTDAKWNDARITYWGMADLRAGSGSQRGYFVNEHEDGDRDWGTFEGKITTSGAQVSIEGTWEYTAGSGKFKGIRGKGSYRGQMTSPSDVETEWKGDYDLP